ncbi:MAG: hypothetical protein HZB38_03385 [Planctomycetes bacterium]|nr:hypothetical protein [Planctomycetota bacterium]
MTEKPAATSEGLQSAPFGAETRRSFGPVIFFAVMYLVWFGFLVWLALTQVGWK